ncbi:peptidyl-prolyl cis-trans isomerase [Ureibacillus composti]|nr:peptidyl-prolyl cis-trans isomerase [Ureibacillus composti]
MRSNPKKAINQMSEKTPLSKRRLKTKPTLTLLIVLFLGNLFWFILWLLPDGERTPKSDGGDELVATVDGEEITRQQWLAAMESLYGKETLQTLVNKAVMEKAAEEYDIEVTEEEINLEIALMRTAQDSTDTSFQQLEEDQLRQKVRAQLILEKVLTKDVVLKDKDIEKYYEENRSLYNIPTTYRTSIIVVQSKDDAESVRKELKDGSNFSVLARERSLDSSSASLGGDIGYVNADQTNIDSTIADAVKSLDEKEISDPFVMSDGRYGIVYLEEIKKGGSFTFDDVKGHIKRELAIEQLPTSVSPEAFWNEFNVTWFYGDL